MPVTTRRVGPIVAEGILWDGPAFEVPASGLAVWAGVAAPSAQDRRSRLFPPEELGQQIEREMVKLGKLVKDANIRAE